MISEPSLDVQAPQVPRQLRLETMVQLKHTGEKAQFGRLEETRGCLLSLPQETIQNTAIPTPFRFAIISVGGKAILLVHLSRSKIQVTSLWYRNKVKTTLLVHHLL